MLRQFLKAIQWDSKWQAAFLARLYAGRLPVKPGAAAFVQGLMVDEIRKDQTGDYAISG